MKKFLVILVVLASLFTVTACGGSKSVTTTGKGESAKDESGNYTTAEVTITDGKFTAVTVDAFYAKSDAWKKELGDDYGMKTKNPAAVGEWYEQAEAFEKWCVGKTPDEVANVATVTNDEGSVVADDADLKTGCTIGIGQFLEAVANAVAAAK